MNLWHKRRTPEHTQQAGCYVLEFEDLWSKDRQFRDWLKTATAGLVARAKQRIRTEIEAHYRQAVAGHVADGLSEPRAKMAAVAELGDAEAAAKRFHKSHLTAAEASFLKRAQSAWWLLGGYFMFCFMRFMDRDLVHWKQEHLFLHALFAVEFLALIVVPTVSFLVARRKDSRLITCLVVFLQTGALCVWALAEMISIQVPAYYLLVNCLLYPWVILIRPVRLWRKLLNAGDDWQEMSTGEAS